jgi:hypothetical protein
MRNISFSATKEQFRGRRKHVTRRGNAAGPTWKNVKPGDHLIAVEKGQGLKKGEKVVRMGEIVVLEVRHEPLWHISYHSERVIPTKIALQYKDCVVPNEMMLEGFPQLTAEQFVEMFCTMNNCTPETEVTRILFDYVDGA